MNDLTYIPLNPIDFLADSKVALMTTEEVGAYILLLFHAWQQDEPGTLTNNNEWLSRWTRTTPERWAEISGNVMSPFAYNESEDRWEQRRLIRTHKQVTETLETRSRAGKKAANIRWHSDCERSTDGLLKEKIENSKTGSNTRRQRVTWDEASGWSDIDSDLMNMWSSAYPNVDVDRELVKMNMWLDANPSKRKTQYKRFIVAWLNRANEKGVKNDNSRNEYEESSIGRTIQI
tara:strand:+ start:1848 stop:2546 length:699 start_codon:yes stop_codon:yes gene_type:complete